MVGIPKLHFVSHSTLKLWTLRFLPFSACVRVPTASNKMSYRASAGKNGAWTRPVTRMYSYNFQVGENYYHPMTTYLDTKYTDINVPLDIPGALSFR
ncbi:hypothetical protein TCAL_10261 [Tigriopus californicus]|uniref:Uncharacterized protein n=1 Tax=Tigriopus californicus TaxID=6832 RepID=A0A553PQ71_TIGCA|nr:hypothetical protein TCAL_10261 [Tigriopus californicus]|eukprot:TCALIF_10261-PA protein Name:"Protein of unknown function" AED:0.52 eAED:0.52 QI:0/0/0/0.5/0/0.5/2/0/96